MRVSLFTLLPLDQAEQRLDAALRAQRKPYGGARPRPQVSGSIRHQRLTAPTYSFAPFGGWISLRGRLLSTASGTRLECHYVVRPVIAVLATVAAIVLAFGVQPLSASWLSRAMVAAGAGAIVAALLAFASPLLMWQLWKDELLGFFKDALDAELLDG